MSTQGPATKNDKRVSDVTNEEIATAVKVLTNLRVSSIFTSTCLYSGRKGVVIESDYKDENSHDCSEEIKRDADSFEVAFAKVFFDLRRSQESRR